MEVFNVKEFSPKVIKDIMKQHVSGACEGIITRDGIFYAVSVDHYSLLSQLMGDDVSLDGALRLCHHFWKNNDKNEFLLSSLDTYLNKDKSIDLTEPQVRTLLGFYENVRMFKRCNSLTDILEYSSNLGWGLYVGFDNPEYYATKTAIANLDLIQEIIDENKVMRYRDDLQIGMLYEKIKEDNRAKRAMANTNIDNVK